jgi:hypothetical protein
MKIYIPLKDILLGPGKRFDENLCEKNYPTKGEKMSVLNLC